jgi:hypothetical protein
LDIVEVIIKMVDDDRTFPCLQDIKLPRRCNVQGDCGGCCGEKCRTWKALMVAGMVKYLTCGPLLGNQWPLQDSNNDKIPHVKPKPKSTSLDQDEEERRRYK